ncbi:putative membrane protein [Novosphingobium chloroacetimidivorans]|uniref:Putative membrane protein n=1 Tax=Novosphingobium chloroacetimidivorans TaxID=1428314 RepID=A0A7W7NWH8_9SPHN|nr:DUF1003 domain-containing protein [Novosphingobium chloroacetimidivorans]MBB4859341.1 putative membrane protein [Novosphingobium chloroacetimidivorans]
MPDTLPPALSMSSALRENIEALSAREREAHANAPFSHRIADKVTAFTGSMTFVVIHLVLFGFWILANTVGIPGVPKFDESLVVLAMEASVEAIFLSTFVLISQNRMAERQNRSADLDLHINLLAEHELTRVAMLLERIARKLDVTVDDLELAEIEADVEPEDVLDALEERQGD